MKIISLITVLAFNVYMMQAQQGSWIIKLNGQTILSTAVENEALHVKKIPAGAWKKNGNLEILFKEAEPGVWYRYFLLYDENDNELLQKDSTATAKISLASLRKLFTGKKEIRIYTTVSPVDPNLAVRVRRVHLCTFKLP